MRATHVTAPGEYKLIDIPKAVAGPGEALIRTTQVSLCGSDYHTVRCLEAHDYPLAPGMSGHEVVGVVEELHGDGGGIKVGDTVLALVSGNRGMAEYSALSIGNMLPLANSNRPTEQLLQAQQLGTVFYACKHLPASVVAKRVVVIGQGSAGLWFNYVLRRFGAREVIAIDLQAHRLALSKDYGATHTIHNLEIDAVEAVRELTGGQMADVVVEAAGEISSITLAVGLVKQHGAILYFGIPRAHSFEFPFDQLFRKFALVRSIAGTLSEENHECTRMALDLIERGDAKAAPMITHHFPFERVVEAYDFQTTRDQGAVKIVVDF